MVSPALIAGGVQLLGNFLGGRKRNKAAGKMEARSVSDRNDAQVIAMQDQARLINYRKDDEARLKAATGFDFAKLVADARAAGFNPLTALQATGGAGYDGRGAVLTTPFVAQVDAYLNASNAVNAARGLGVETAGYLGDSIAAGGSAYFSQLNQDRSFAQAQQSLDLAAAELMSRGAFGGGSVVKTAVVSPQMQIFGAEGLGGAIKKGWQGLWSGVQIPDSWYTTDFGVLPPVKSPSYSATDGFGNRTILPTSDNDMESIFTGIGINSWNLAKERGFIAKDAEAPFFAQATNFGANMVAAGRGVLAYGRALGMWPQW